MNAIHMVEEEAHTSNLTQRIKQLLNVQESQIERDTQTNNQEDDSNNILNKGH